MSSNRWSAQTLHRSGLILGVLSLCAFLGLGLWFWQASAAQERTSDARAARLRVVELGGKDLSTALDKQRAQFLACAQAAPGTPGCYAPVAPPAKEVAPQIITGPTGAQGFQGVQGIQGAQGVKGDTGLTGINGIAGTGTNGTNGADGTSGPAGAQGDPGPAGAPGADGADGPAGQSAYPFTFTFRTTGGMTYTCTLPASGEPGTCTEALPAPTPTPTATP